MGILRVGNIIASQQGIVSRRCNAEIWENYCPTTYKPVEALHIYSWTLPFRYVTHQSQLSAFFTTWRRLIPLNSFCSWVKRLVKANSCCLCRIQKLNALDKNINEMLNGCRRLRTISTDRKHRRCSITDKVFSRFGMKKEPWWMRRILQPFLVFQYSIFTSLF